MIDKKAFEFDLESDDDQWTFLAVKVHARDEPGWFNLYIFDDEGGDFTFVASLDEKPESAITAATEYVVREFEIDAETLQVPPVRTEAPAVSREELTVDPAWSIEDRLDRLPALDVYALFHARAVKVLFDEHKAALSTGESVHDEALRAALAEAKGGLEKYADKDHWTNADALFNGGYGCGDDARQDYYRPSGHGYTIAADCLEAVKKIEEGK